MFTNSDITTYIINIGGFSISDIAPWFTISTTTRSFLTTIIAYDDCKVQEILGDVYVRLDCRTHRRLNLRYCLLYFSATSKSCANFCGGPTLLHFHGNYARKIHYIDHTGEANYIYLYMKGIKIVCLLHNKVFYRRVDTFSYDCKRIASFMKAFMEFVVNDGYLQFRVNDIIRETTRIDYRILLGPDYLTHPVFIKYIVDAAKFPAIIESRTAL